MPKHATTILNRGSKSAHHCTENGALNKPNHALAREITKTTTHQPSHHHQSAEIYCSGGARAIERARAHVHKATVTSRTHDKPVLFT